MSQVSFHQTFVLLEGEMEATTRGKKSTVRAGETLNVPANAPHQFHNVPGIWVGCPQQCSGNQGGSKLCRNGRNM
jgi:quercetin dioxygenase-like cupin family protein